MTLEPPGSLRFLAQSFCPTPQSQCGCPTDLGFEDAGVEGTLRQDMHTPKGGTCRQMVGFVKTMGR